MDKTNRLLSSLPRRPLVTKCQAVAMATRVFNLEIKNDSSVKEMDSYDDRNFYIQGFLQGASQHSDSPACEEFVLKIMNHVDSNHEYLIQTQCNVMSFLRTRGHKCSSPVPSIFGSSFVMCKIPRNIPNNRVALTTDGSKDGFRSEFEVYHGEEYLEEEYFVCAVMLLRFVHGTVLNETPLTTQLLFDAGMAVGRLDRDLKDLGCPKLERTGYIWDLATAGDKMEEFLEAVDIKEHADMVREVCETFRNEVTPKLHLLPMQMIHGDANYTNILLTSDSSASFQEFGFIDFADVNYSCRVFEIAVSLMYIFNISSDLSCGRSRIAGHFFAGYHSVNPLSDVEIELLPVLIASRFCQSLVIAAFYSKYLSPDNAYVMETSTTGWSNFQAFCKLPKEEIMSMWLQIRR